MNEQSQLALFDDLPSVDMLLRKREDQWFDRKSVRIKNYDLATHMIGFANSDGGRIAVGIAGGMIEGVNSDPDQLNSLMQAAIDFVSPPVRHTAHFIESVNKEGKPDRILLLDIEASETIHRNKRHECYLRVGDETRRLGPTEERELLFDKGESVYDKSIVRELTRDDLDMSSVQAYAQKMGAKDILSLARSRGIFLEGPYNSGVTHAGWLLFGRTPPIWSYVRYLRYDGVTVETGVRSNLIEDVRLEGTIPTLIEETQALVRERILVIRLTQDGRFNRVPALPEFAWLEAVVNAVTHRSYSLQGDGVRIRQFTDRLEVESPGRLPGLVRVQNIQNARFSRNPHIARVLAEMTSYVRESNEGVRRMFEEMEQSGLRAPVYESMGASVRVTLYKEPDSNFDGDAAATFLSGIDSLRQRFGDKIDHLIMFLRDAKHASTGEIARQIGVNRFTARRYLEELQSAGLVVRSGKSSNDPTAAWSVAQVGSDDGIQN